MKSEIRKDYIQEKYVIIAPRRDARPGDIKTIEKFIRERKSEKCPFCPGESKHETGVYCVTKHGKFIYPKSKQIEWDIKVIPNKYPAVSLDNQEAYGQQEVVIESSDHRSEFENLSKHRISRLLKVYADRTVEITKNDKIEYVLIFKNQGGRAGASLEHSHSQIFATDFIPPHLIDKAQRIQRYKLEHGTCAYCDVISKEQNSPRLVYKDSYVIAFCPYAPMHNWEVWIMPLRHIDNITMLNQCEKDAWAGVLKKVLPKITALGLDYNYYFHQVVNDEDQHLYMKITPRGSVWAGVEIGSGIVINPVSPEDSAKYYRE